MNGTAEEEGAAKAARGGGDGAGKHGGGVFVFTRRGRNELTKRVVTISAFDTRRKSLCCLSA